MRARVPLVPGWRPLGSFLMDRRRRQTTTELPSSRRMRTPAWVLAVGCSMTYGSELYDDAAGQCTDDRARQDVAWPAQLGRRLGLESRNMGMPGGSNDRIVRKVLAVLAEVLHGRCPPPIVVVGWSGPTRMEIRADGEWIQVDAHTPQAFRNSRLAGLAAELHTHASDGRASAQRWLAHAIGLGAVLDRHGVPYVFFDAIQSLRRLVEERAPELTEQLLLLDARRYVGLESWDGDMLSQLRVADTTWCGKHPGPDGHSAWAQLLEPYVHAATDVRRPTPAAEVVIHSAPPGDHEFVYP